MKRGFPSSALRAPSPAQKAGEGSVHLMPSPALWREKAAEGRMRVCITALSLYFLCLPAFAVQPDEILSDPGLETRARDISAGLRCLVCQNQSIDDSDASVAKDLRVLIREQLLQKKSDPEIIDFVVARYGEYVLLKPRFKPTTLLLWASPFLILAAGLLLAFRRKATPTPEALSDAEKSEIAAILRK